MLAKIRHRNGGGFRGKRAVLGLLMCLAALLAAGCSGPRPAQPNIIFVLTDDLDYASASQFPTLRSQLIEKGASFENAFISYPLCCPSRSTILTGLYAHNHGVKNNEPPNGGVEKFLSEGNEENTIAVRLQQSGYETALLGKYLNKYPTGSAPTHVPPGWDDWHAKGDVKYYNYNLNENGTVVSYGKSSKDYLTDVLSGDATNFVRHATSDSKPFFLYLAPTAPHTPATPAERHQDAYAGETAPRPPSFDEEDVSDKPPWIQSLDRISEKQASKIDEHYRKRLSSMLAVDDMLDSLVRELEADGQLYNTFIFFTSDNGLQQGEHRIQSGKDTPYEESAHVPLFVRGPGIAAGSKIEKLVVNTDFAPTFADLAGASFPADGRSIKPLLRGEDPSWRSAILLEGFSDKEGKEKGKSKRKARKKARLPTYAAIRTETSKYVEYDTGDKELYDLEADPYELDSADPSQAGDLKTRLDALRNCAGDACREAEDAL